MAMSYIMSGDDTTHPVLTGLDAAPGEGRTGAETVITRDIEILLLSLPSSAVFSPHHLPTSLPSTSQELSHVLPPGDPAACCHPLLGDIMGFKPPTWGREKIFQVRVPHRRGGLGTSSDD